MKTLSLVEMKHLAAASPGRKKSLKDHVRAAIHFTLRAALPRPRAVTPNPSRILLMSSGHVGDAVIATSLLPVLKAAYPGVEIGFVVASWSVAAINRHPDVSYTHIVDHKIMNRQLTGRAKLHRYAETRKKALAEIKKLSYDVCISLHPWRPDLVRLGWQANIPVRVAFTNSLLAPLATHLAEYPEHNTLIPHGEALARLLLSLGISPEMLQLRRSSLAPDTEAAVKEVENLIAAPSLRHRDYAIIHIGSGVPAKELPNSFWREFARLLVLDTTIIFTGKGPSEASNITEVVAGLPNCANAANRLSWDGFVAAVRRARIVYTVDTMAGHVAAAVSTPCVSIFGGNNGVGRWRPEGKEVLVWSQAMECAPCRNMHGCSDMKCMQGFSPQLILANSIAKASAKKELLQLRFQ